jgi:hypothetical protein
VTTLYRSVLCTHEHTLSLTRTCACIHSHVFTSCCLVMASNGGHSLSSGILNYPQPQLAASYSNGGQHLSPSCYLTHPLTNHPFSTNEIPGWQPPDTNLILFSLPSKDSRLSYGSWFLLRSLGMDQTENTTSNTYSIVACYIAVT